MEHKLDYYLTHFVNTWGKSLDQRLKASRYYAEAINTDNAFARYSFENLPDFKEWTKKQWRLVYLVGSGVIIPEYLDVHNPGIGIVMARYKVSQVDQADILGNGLHMATITGGQKVVQIKNMEEHHIAQVFIADGSKRSHADQVKWLKDLVRPNLEVLDNHCVRVAHACHISPAELSKLLTTKPFPLSADALMALAQTVSRRAAR